MKQSELIQLTKDVFDNPLGKQWLKEFEKDICSPNMYHPDRGKRDWRIGQVDLLRRTQSFVEMDRRDMEHIVKEEKRLAEEITLDKTFNEFGDIIT